MATDKPSLREMRLEMKIRMPTASGATSACMTTSSTEPFMGTGSCRHHQPHRRLEEECHLLTILMLGDRQARRNGMPALVRQFVFTCAGQETTWPGGRMSLRCARMRFTLAGSSKNSITTGRSSDRSSSVDECTTPERPKPETP